MHVLKVELEGLTTSFRYPHFMAGRHPTFPMPPPATIYGHICSTIGEWFDPAGVEFGYVFTHESKTTDMDLEHCHILSVASSRANFDYGGESFATNLDGVVNPYRRDFFFRPRLTLYLNQPDWIKHFREPRYPVVLGRSQDLATYTRISTVELVEKSEAYYENTLLPFAWRVCTARGVTLTMPRYLDYYRNREPHFDRYIALQGSDFTADWLRYEREAISHWVDPETVERRGCKRGVVFHRFA
jgi:CRISPR-associated protein Cas5t